MQYHSDGTKVVDLKGTPPFPGLNDSHLHLIRGGLNYNLELRWEGVPSLADALRMLKEQALRTRRRNGYAWWAAGANSSLPNAACRRWTRLTTPRRIPRSLSCISTTAPCSTAPR
jgi:predicted amidohydrolase YtcJ